MIADYLYNTPAPPAGSTVAVVLFATAYEDSESLNAADVGTDRVVPTQRANQHQRMADAHAPLLHCWG